MKRQFKLNWWSYGLIFIILVMEFIELLVYWSKSILDITSSIIIILCIWIISDSKLIKGEKK